MFLTPLCPLFHLQRFGGMPAFVLAFIIFFCGVVQAEESTPADASAGSGSASVGAPVHGDDLLYGMIGAPGNLLPFMSTDTASREVASQFYVAPLRYDKNIEIEPWAAESYEVLDNGLRLRFVLKKGILWQDGTELTADDVEFTYKLMIDPKTPTAYAADFKAVESFTKLDRYSFEVRYAKPFARSLVTWMTDIMPKHLLEGQDLRTSPLAQKPVSSGPFLLAENRPGSLLTMTANPNYFEGRPNINRLVYRIIPDAGTMFMELKAGKLDLDSALTPQQYIFQAKKPEFAKEYALYTSLASVYVYLGYNPKSPFFNDERVRLAFAHALNKADIVKGALLGQGQPTIGPYKPGTWPYNNDIVDYPNDPQKALALLAEAGWKPNADGRLEKDGRLFSFTVLVNQGNEARIKTAVIIQSQLDKLGIEMNIRTLEWAAFLNIVQDRHFDAVVLGWTIPADTDGYDVWHSSGVGGMLNFVDFANPEADDILERARSTFDQDERQKLYGRLQEILHQHQPYCFLYVPLQTAAVQRRFQGIKPAPAGFFYNFNDWWVPISDQRYRMAP